MLKPNTNWTKLPYADLENATLQAQKVTWFQQTKNLDPEPNAGFDTKLIAPSDPL